MALPIATRPYDKRTDAGFLYTAWINSFRSSEHAGVVPDHAFYDVTKVVINQLFARGLKVLMAVSPDDPNQLIGFIAYEDPGPVLHYVFVKDLFREQGVANQLKACANFLPGEPIFHTFRTSSARYLGPLVYRPGFARRKRAYSPEADGALGV